MNIYRKFSIWKILWLCSIKQYNHKSYFENKLQVISWSKCYFSFSNVWKNKNRHLEHFYQSIKINFMQTGGIYQKPCNHMRGNKHRKEKWHWFVKETKRCIVCHICFVPISRYCKGIQLCILFSNICKIINALLYL